MVAATALKQAANAPAVVLSVSFHDLTVHMVIIQPIKSLLM